MCPHSPPCPEASAPDREAAHTVVSHPEQGWSLLCNGIVIFEDTGELLPDGASIAPHRPTDLAFDPALGTLQPASGRGSPAEPLIGHGQDQPVQAVIPPFGIAVERRSEPGIGRDKPTGAVEGQPQHVFRPR